MTIPIHPDRSTTGVIVKEKTSTRAYMRRNSVIMRSPAPGRSISQREIREGVQSHTWPVRNAAMQETGAIIRKKRFQEYNDDTRTTRDGPKINPKQAPRYMTANPNGRRERGSVDLIIPPATALTIADAIAMSTEERRYTYG